MGSGQPTGPDGPISSTLRPRSTSRRATQAPVGSSPPANHQARWACKHLPPQRVATAGEEQLVDSAAQEAVVHELPDVRHITIEGAKHEILMEVDPIRNQFWEAFDQLIERIVPARV